MTCIPINKLEAAGGCCFCFTALSFYSSPIISFLFLFFFFPSVSVSLFVSILHVLPSFPLWLSALTGPPKSQLEEEEAKKHSGCYTSQRDYIGSIGVLLQGVFYPAYVCSRIGAVCFLELQTTFKMTCRV